jgi:2-polyprenyl-3-methyl-5-hydroxy-6-metoxy-1,4-benzoquinol methylase
MLTHPRAREFRPRITTVLVLNPGSVQGYRAYAPLSVRPNKDPQVQADTGGRAGLGTVEAVSFDVSPEAYTRFMGRYSEPLAILFAGLAGVRQGQRALDVGCGPGALTAELVRRLGPEAVSAVDPSEPFVAAVRGRCPGVRVQRVAGRAPLVV